MRLPAGLRVSLTIITAIVLVVIYVPLLFVVLNSFNTDRTFGWPPPGYTTHWWSLRLAQPGSPRGGVDLGEGRMRRDGVALVLGTLAAMALRRTRFFGRNVVSLLIILPIALPGIVTGLALRTASAPSSAST